MRVIEKETSRPPLLREVEAVDDQLKTNRIENHGKAKEE